MRIVLVILVACWANVSSQSVSAAIQLSGVSYIQDFDGLGTSIPTGVGVYTGATATALGSSQAFSTSSVSWGDAAGAFKNLASTTGLTSSATVAAQSGSTDRALGVRQTATFGDPGAAFAFQFDDTLGFTNFNLTFQSEMASVQGRSTTWTVDWGLGAVPASFTALSPVISDPGVFGETGNSYVLPSAINNQSSPLWIRIAALAATAGSNNRDTFSIDDFRLTFQAAGTAAVPEASSLLVWGLIGSSAGFYRAFRKPH